MEELAKRKNIIIINAVKGGDIAIMEVEKNANYLINPSTRRHKKT